MKTEDYKTQIQLLLNDTIYEKLQRNPTSRIEKERSEGIKKSGLDDDTKRRLMLSNSQVPRLYALPKVHKIGFPLRPIVSAINAPS